MPDPQRKQLRHAYGFDDVAIVPGETTLNPELVDVSTTLAGLHLPVPVLAAAMDAVVVDADTLVFAVEGLQCRFDDPDEVLQRVAASDTEGATNVLQDAYMTPIRPDLVTTRIQQITDGGVQAAVSVTPPNTKQLAPLVQEAGAGLLVVQSTVTTARHEASSCTN